MLLAFILRNDKITLGFFEGNELKGQAKIATDTRRTADEYAILLKDILAFHGFTREDFSDAIFASVVPALSEVLREAVQMLLGVRAHLIGSGIRTGLTILTENPAELGGDLVASAVGALERYAPPLTLVELGTAVTFSVLNQDGAFLGCAIAPGVRLSASALKDAAELLPHTATKTPKSVIGKNTVESLQCGSVYGAAAMIDGMLDRIEKETGKDATVLLSGEDAAMLLPLLSHKVTRDESLALYGLSAIYKKNKRPSKK